MRSLLVSVLLLAFGVACFAQVKPQPKPKRTPAPSERASGRSLQEDQKAIAELQQRDITASIALDTDELLSLWADDGVLIPPEHAPVVGKDALRAFYDQYKKAMGNNEILGYDENWDEVNVVGDWAFQWGTISARIRPAGSTNEVTNAIHAMRILKREPDGSWLVARAIWNNAQPAPNTPPAPPK